MKRLRLLSWKRLGIHSGVVGGLGLAYAMAPEPEAVAQAECMGETDCSFNKPNILLVLDYSSSMRKAFADETENPVGERWQGAEDAVRAVLDADNGFFDESMHLAMMRFGSAQSSPSPTCGFAAGEATKVDVPWYDLDGPDYTYTECNGDAIRTALDAISYPGSSIGCATWTKAALEKAQELVGDSRTQHAESDDPADNAYRYYGVILMTDGAWNGPGGDSPRDIADDPAPVAADIYGNMGVPVYVVALTTQAALIADADAIASMGGTMTAIDGSDPTKLEDALQGIIDEITDSIIVPKCTEGQPRVMIVLDASTSMLNVGNSAGAMGQTGWDQSRAALAGANSIFDVEVNAGNNAAEDLMHLGLIVFGDGPTDGGGDQTCPDDIIPDCCTLFNICAGGAASCNGDPCPGGGGGGGEGEEELLVQYGPCMKDNFDWALDPVTSCDAPGCTDPWGGPPIDWTFKTSPPSTANGAPPFNVMTRSHMPQCTAGGGNACGGSRTFTHRGLEMAWDNLRFYQDETKDSANHPFPTSDDTTFLNILITDGDYMGYSTDAQVQGALEVMYNNDVTTYVIGFGDGIAQNLLNQMADWGSGGTQEPFAADTQEQLETALATILENVNFDPCCGFNDCSAAPEPPYAYTDTDDLWGDTDGKVPDYDTTSSSSSSSSGGETDSDSASSSSTSSTSSSGGSTSSSTGGSTSSTTGSTSATGTSTGTGSSSTGGDTDSGTAGTATASGTASGTTATATSESASSGTATAGETDTAGAAGPDDGCGCTTDAPNRGAAGGLMLVGLAAGFRRRRR